MDSLNWVIQGSSLAAAVWFFTQWWKDDRRIAVLAKPALVAASLLGGVVMISTTMYSNAILRQWDSADEQVHEAWMKQAHALDAFERRLQIDGIRLTAEQNALVEGIVPPPGQRVIRLNSDLVSERSWLCFLLVYLSIAWAANVRAPLPSAQAEKQADGERDSNEGK